MRKISLILTIAAALLAGGNAYWNELRASTGCGPDYSWVFSHEKGVRVAIGTAWPVVLFAFAGLVLGVNKYIKRATLSFSVFMLAMCLYVFIDDYSRMYAPCDRNGDESSLFLVLAAGAMVFLWFVFVLPSLLAQPSSGGNCLHEKDGGNQQNSN